MSLTKEDLSEVRDVVVEALEAIVLPRFDTLEGDVAVLKTDVAVLKTDVAELKTDVVKLQQDMREVKGTLKNIDDRVTTMENDIKEIYYMIANLQKTQSAGKKFSKLSLEQKLLKINQELLIAAKEAGIELPR